MSNSTAGAGLNKVTGKLRDPAILWRLEREPQGQRTGGNG